MIIGICGKSGSGKSTLANKIVQNHNLAIHCDIDKIGHKVLTIKEVQKELTNCFGNEILNGHDVDRKKLGELVFNSRQKMQKLSLITWKYMELEIDSFLSKNKNKIVVLDWILLPLSKYFEMCEITILLDTSYEIRMNRAIKRDNITEKTFELREKASLNYNEKDFNFVIKDSDENEIKRIVSLL